MRSPHAALQPCGPTKMASGGGQNAHFVNNGAHHGGISFLDMSDLSDVEKTRMERIIHSNDSSRAVTFTNTASEPSCGVASMHNVNGINYFPYPHPMQQFPNPGGPMHQYPYPMHYPIGYPGYPFPMQNPYFNNPNIMGHGPSYPHYGQVPYQHNINNSGHMPQMPSNAQDSHSREDTNGSHNSLTHEQDNQFSSEPQHQSELKPSTDQQEDNVSYFPERRDEAFSALSGVSGDEVQQRQKDFQTQSNDTMGLLVEQMSGLTSNVSSILTDSEMASSYQLQNSESDMNGVVISSRDGSQIYQLESPHTITSTSSPLTSPGPNMTSPPEEDSPKATIDPIASIPAQDPSSSPPAPAQVPAPPPVITSWASLFNKSSGEVKAPISINDSNVNSTSSEQSVSSNANKRPTSGKNPNVKASQPLKTHTAPQQTNVTSNLVWDPLDIKLVSPDEDPYAWRLAQRISNIHLLHTKHYPIPRGFINRSNWCYINATLQALLACPPFYNLLRELNEMRLIQLQRNEKKGARMHGHYYGITRDATCTPTLDAFSRLIDYFLPTEAHARNRSLNQSSQAKDGQDEKRTLGLSTLEPVDPVTLTDCLSSIKGLDCMKGRQEDAEEFLSALLNVLHEEMKSLFELFNANPEGPPMHSASFNGTVTDAVSQSGESASGAASSSPEDEEEWREVGHRNRSQITRSIDVCHTHIYQIFGGQTNNLVKRGNANPGINRQPFFILQLHIQNDKVRNLTDALRLISEKEPIDNGPDYVQSIFYDLPPVLIIHLKLFIHETQESKSGDGVEIRVRKCMKQIDYPMEFDMPRECFDTKYSANIPKSRHARSYKLLSVVYHSGKEMAKGHYLTDMYHIGSQQWIRCDDSNLTAISGSKVLKPEAPLTPYLLFYRRCDTINHKTYATSGNTNQHQSAAHSRDYHSSGSRFNRVRSANMQDL